MSNVSSNNPSAQPRLDHLQDRLGYQFRNTELLQLALTHKSYAKNNNERLEFVGDAVLGYVIGTRLFHHFPTLQEDALSLMRASLVRGTTLAEVAAEIGVAECLSLGSGERKSGGRSRGSILADAFEAIVGAIHEDSGIQNASTVIRHLFDERIEHLNLEELKDAKTKLQEHLQGKGLSLPDYEVIEVTGADHARRYTVACRVAGLDGLAQGVGSSRRKAEQAAAEALLEALLSA